MKFLNRVSLLAAFSCSIVFASENLPVCGSEKALPGAACRGRDVGLEANQRISIYLHPVSLISSLAVNSAPLLLYLTGEFPMSRFNSLIVNPSFWNGGKEGQNYFRLGSGVGIRRYANGEANGLYLELMGSAHYLKMKEKAILSDEFISSSGPFFDILGYIGYTAKYSGISIYYDFGVGYGWSKIKKNSDEKWTISDFSGGSGLSFDINIGIGIPF